MTPHRLQCCIYYIYVINAAFIPGSNPSFPVSKISLRRLACLHGNSDECLCMTHEASLGTVFVLQPTVPSLRGQAKFRRRVLTDTCQQGTNEKIRPMVYLQFISECAIPRTRA